MKKILFAVAALAMVTSAHAGSIELACTPYVGNWVNAPKVECGDIDANHLARSSRGVTPVVVVVHPPVKPPKGGK